MKTNRIVLARLIGLLGISLVSVAQAQQVVEAPEGATTNMIGLAVGSAPDFWGSDKNTGVAAPVFRYQFAGTERYISLNGANLKINLLDDKKWAAGVYATYRAARDGEVEDSVVKLMDKVDSAGFVGGFAEYKMALDDIGTKAVFGGNIAGNNDNGTESNLYARYYRGFGDGWTGNVGLTMTYGNDKLNETYFGITSAHDIALYPSLGGAPYEASSGIVGWSVPFGVTKKLNKEWMMIAGGRYQKLVGDAKDSPIVDLHGNSSQWTAAVGAAYLF